MADTKIIRIYVDEDTKKKVQEHAAKMQLSESAWVRLAILRFIASFDEYCQRQEEECRK